MFNLNNCDGGNGGEPLSIICVADTVNQGEQVDTFASASGGTPPYTYSIIAGPSWATINPNTGQISGTAGLPGSYAVRVRVTDAGGSTPQQCDSIITVNGVVTMSCCETPAVPQLNPTITVSSSQNLTNAIAAAPNGSVIKLNPGVYTDQAFLNNKSNVTLYSDGGAILDGSNGAVPWGQGQVFVAGGSNNRILNLEVRNVVNGRGIFTIDSPGTIIEHNEVHEVYHRSISISSDNNIIRHNLIYRGGLGNEDGINNMPAGQSWPSILGTWNKPDGTWTTGIKIYGNTVHSSWGEAIGINATLDSEVYCNICYNCWSVGIYANDCQNADIYRNLIYATTDEYNRPNQGHRMTGISFAVEQNNPNPRPNIGNHAYANIIVDTGRGINWWNQGNVNSYYRDLKIYNNHIAPLASQSDSIQIANTQAASDAEIFNNALSNNMSLDTSNSNIQQGCNVVNAAILRSLNPDDYDPAASYLRDIGCSTPFSEDFFCRNWSSPLNAGVSAE